MSRPSVFSDKRPSSEVKFRTRGEITRSTNFRFNTRRLVSSLVEEAAKTSRSWGRRQVERAVTISVLDAAELMDRLDALCFCLFVVLQAVAKPHATHVPRAAAAAVGGHGRVTMRHVHTC